MKKYQYNYVFTIVLLVAISNKSLFSQQFTEVAAELGVQDSAKFSGNDIHWVDFNGDNLLDLYVVNPGAFILPDRTGNCNKT